jgi:activator of 2-hydroxyglutaryl-CoA dehydratase
MLGEILGIPVMVPEKPHLAGALGAALLARDLFSGA